MYKAGIITASDKGYHGEREDLSGAKIAEIMEQHGYENFCRLWAYKESYVKYTGIGLVKGMDYYSVVKPDGALTGEEHVWQKQIAFQSECYMVVTAKQEAEIKLFSLTEQGEK